MDLTREGPDHQERLNGMPLIAAFHQELADDILLANLTAVLGDALDSGTSHIALTLDYDDQGWKVRLAADVAVDEPNV